MEITGIEYLDFLPEETLETMALVVEPEVTWPIEHLVSKHVYRTKDGEFIDAATAHSLSYSPIPCPFVNDKMVWRLPIGSGPVYDVQTIRAEKRENGAWFWRVCFKRMAEGVE